MNSLVRRALFAVLLMLLSSARAYALTPTRKLAVESPIDLDLAIPARFGDWQQEAQDLRVIVNPQQAELLGKLYSQLVTRSYLNTRTGARIMLSIAYGEDQRDSTQMHYPEVCYPAQGFQLVAKSTGVISTPFGGLAVKRLVMAQGARNEPITYWSTIGDRVTTSGLSKKTAELTYGLFGVIPDGMLFRVSSIDANSAHAFLEHSGFIVELLQSTDANSRHRVSGLQ